MFGGVGAYLGFSAGILFPFWLAQAYGRSASGRPREELETIVEDPTATAPQPIGAAYMLCRIDPAAGNIPGGRPRVIAFAQTHRGGPGTT